MRSYQPDRTKSGCGFGSMIARVPALAKRMAGVEITSLDADEVIAGIDNPAAVVYADPPYPSAHQSYYLPGIDHAALEEALLASPARVAVSGYAGERPALDGWRAATLTVQVNLKDQNRSQRATECLWMNYPPG